MTRIHASPAPAAAPRPSRASRPARIPAVREILHGPRVQRDDLDAVVIESERMRDAFRADARRMLRQRIADLERFPFSTTDPNRGFRPQDLAALDTAGVSITFAGSLSPIPADMQTMLLDNIAATVRFVLDPNNPDRIIELAALEQRMIAAGQGANFVDQPAGRIDATDLYHGHVCVDPAVLAANTTFQTLRNNPYSGFGSGGGSSPNDDIDAAIGIGMPVTRPEARAVMGVVGRHRAAHLQTLSTILQALANEPRAGILYHTWEHDRPRIGRSRMPPDNPVRHIFTPFSTSRPMFRAPSRDCSTLINFGFHLDRRGRITLFPETGSEMPRAFEILHGWGTAPP